MSAGLGAEPQFRGLVGAGFLYLALRNVDFSQMGEAFLSADYGYLLGTLVIIFFSLQKRFVAGLLSGGLKG